jgi:hypothetical protein
MLPNHVMNMLEQINATTENSDDDKVQLEVKIISSLAMASILISSCMLSLYLYYRSKKYANIQKEKHRGLQPCTIDIRSDAPPLPLQNA